MTSVSPHYSRRVPEMSWETVLVAATAAHAGFQLAVTGVVYPALTEVPEQGWTQAHARHSRRIVPLVAAVYGGVVVSAAGSLATRPSTPALLSALASAVSLGTTTLVAAPLHGRLGSGRDDALLSRLLRADRLRSAGAVVALAAALVQLGRARPVASRSRRRSTSES